MTSAKKYFKTEAEAMEVAISLPEFEPSKYLAKYEIEQGLGKARVVVFQKGFAVQLGAYGSYYPSATADLPESTR